MLFANRFDSAPTVPQLRVDDVKVPVPQIVMEPKALARTLDDWKVDTLRHEWPLPLKNHVRLSIESFRSHLQSRHKKKNTIAIHTQGLRVLLLAFRCHG